MQSKTTKSAVLSSNETLNNFLMKWCEFAVMKGGTFAIDETFEEGTYYTQYTIYWWPENEIS
jgi:hypothetical protein